MTDGVRRVVVTLDVPIENTLDEVETDLRHYFAGVVSVEEAEPPRGRWLHAHRRSCAVQVWFQADADGEPPECTCDSKERR